MSCVGRIEAYHERRIIDFILHPSCHGPNRLLFNLLLNLPFNYLPFSNHWHALINPMQTISGILTYNTPDANGLCGRKLRQYKGRGEGNITIPGLECACNILVSGRVLGIKFAHI